MKTILFWTKYNGEQNESSWRNFEVKISPFHFLSLSSHLKFGNEVYLYSYQKISGAPDGVILLDASDLYDSELAFSALERGHSIAHISDLVRIRAAAHCSGMILDMDAVSLREMPETEDSIFSSMPAKLLGAFAPKWGKSKPPMPVHDESWDGKALSSFPVKLCKKTSAPSLKLSNEIELVLQTPPHCGSKSWNFVMWGMKDIARDCKTARCVPPIKFAPIPAWTKPGNCFSIESPTRLDGDNELFGYKLPSIDEIVQESYVVQHFFESAFQNAEEKDVWFWAMLPYDCLLAMEAEHILGDNWREILTNKN